MSLPFLPEPEAVVHAAPKTNGRRTLLLWVVLIVMFLTIWQFLSPSPKDGQVAAQHAAAQAADGAACSSSFWSSSTVVLLPLLFIVIMMVLFFRAYRQNTEFQLAQEPGRAAMAQRRFAEAIEKFRVTIPRFSKQPGYRAVAVLNVAEAQLRAGQLDAAIASCAEIERARTMLFGSGLRVRIATLTALVYGLRGDIPTAERWTSDARARIAKNREDRFGHAAHLCLAEAVLASRKGDHAGAVALLDRSWNELRYALSADQMRIVEVVRAFAEAQAGVRASNAVAERLVRVEPITAGELAFLGIEWPEMQAFLGAHGAS